MSMTSAAGESQDFRRHADKGDVSRVFLIEPVGEDALPEG
jgi:hypothetical protein